jgi:hypothetical protein
LDGYHRGAGCESENKVDLNRIKESNPQVELALSRAVAASETGGVTVGIKSGYKRWACIDSFFSEDKIGIKAGEEDTESISFVCDPILEEHYINGAWVKVKTI